MRQAVVAPGKGLYYIDTGGYPLGLRATTQLIYMTMTFIYLTTKRNYLFIKRFII